jgi:subtilisin family serine protease
MTKRYILTVGIGLIVLFALPFTGFGERWILSPSNNTLHPDLEDRITKAGGTLLEILDEVALVVADFSKQEDVKTMEADGYEVLPDILLNWLTDDRIPDGEHIDLFREDFSGFQWHLPVIGADRAADLGYTGAGVRIAIVDTGIWYYHPDLIENIDFESGASFVPGVADFLDDEGHGTHVAGIIAATDDGWGVKGIAPHATLIPIKVLSRDGTGSISWLADGIIHAVKQRADIINLSLGTYLKRSGYPPYYTANQATLIRKMIRNVVNWATSQGVLVVNSAGNASVDFDHSSDIISIPTEEGNGIVVSATGPVGFEYFDTAASYTNYGSSVILLSAPGGDFRYYPEDGWWNDMILSTSINGWMWAAGTSMSSAMVSGTAALVIEKYGHIRPGQLKNILANTADDLGAPGKDPYYGRGRVNAYRAVR